MKKSMRKSWRYLKGFRNFAKVRPQVARLTEDEYFMKELNKFWKGAFTPKQFLINEGRKPKLATGESLTVGTTGNTNQGFESVHPKGEMWNGSRWW